MPLYQLIFLEECKFMSEGAIDSIREYGDYLFSEEVTYLRMYGGTKAPSLLPKYVTDYVVHKEAVRQLFLDGENTRQMHGILQKSAYNPQ